MSAKNITILTPNGHRPVIKVSSHTTILEALEQACQKQNFDPEKYDLKQGNKILDVNTTFGYANIPNNARLEMVLCKTPRVISNVTVNVVMESGEKYVKEFIPTTNIETILTELGIKYEPETAFLIYLQRRILGKDFKSTTLRSLGLTQGKHLFRFKTETTKEQAHVYVPAKPKVSETDDTKPSCSKAAPVPAPKAEEPKTEKPKAVDNNKPSLAQKKPMDPISVLRAEKLNAKKPKSGEETEETSVVKQEAEPMEVCDTEVTKVEQNGVAEVKMEQESLQLHILGERDALVYNRDHVKPVVHQETPDSFFEPTKSDVIAILEDRKKALESMNNAPLLTSSLKEAIRQKEMETKLKKFEKTVIRIHFPNQLVLQGVFSPVETVEVVKKFVRTYLQDSKSDFTLYTIPPRTDLDPKGRLIDLDLVPSSNVYYSGASELKSEIQSKLTDPTSADLQANNIRLKTTHDVAPQEDSSSVQTAPKAADPQPGPSRTNDEPARQPAPQRPPAPRQSQPSDAKVPKWFKPFGK